MRRRTVKREQFARTEIPDAIQRDLNSVGGIQGLCSSLPDNASLRRVTGIHHALSDPVRIRILHLVAIQPLCVCVIKACIDIADSKLSYHLAILKRAGLIKGTQQGNWIIYSITDVGRKYLQQIP